MDEISLPYSVRLQLPWARAKMRHAIAAHGRAVKRYVDFLTERAMTFQTLPMPARRQDFKLTH